MTSSSRALAILHDVDRKLDGWTCDASTDCCRFSVTGREPSLTSAEWSLVVAEVRRQGRKLPALNDDADGRCPFLGADDRCSVYAARPLGCRTFFCERACAPVGAPSYASIVKAARDEVHALEAISTGDARTLRSWLSDEGGRTQALRRARRR